MGRPRPSATTTSNDAWRSSSSDRSAYRASGLVHRPQPVIRPRAETATHVAAPLADRPFNRSNSTTPQTAYKKTHIRYRCILLLISRANKTGWMRAKCLTYNELFSPRVTRLIPSQA